MADAAAEPTVFSETTALAFEDVYARQFGEAVRLAYLLTGDLALAQDLAQDVFVRLIGRLRAIREPNAVRAYVRRAVTNAVIAQARKRHGARVSGEQVDVADVAAPEDLMGATWQAVLRLAERQRAAVVLRYWLDLSEAETAKIMKCHPGTVKALAAKGLAHLREGLVADADS